MAFKDVFDRTEIDHKNKPFKGTFNNWRKVHDDLSPKDSLGFYLVGDFVDHPKFAGNWGHTSYVIAINDEYAETLNSVYKLGKEEEVKDVD